MGFTLYMCRVPQAIDSACDQGDEALESAVTASVKATVEQHGVRVLLEALLACDPSEVERVRAHPEAYQEAWLVARAVLAWKSLFLWEDSVYLLMIGGVTHFTSGGDASDGYPTSACREIDFLVEGRFAVTGEG